MQDFAAAFYKSKQWQRTREIVWQRAGGLCEECLKNGLCTAGEIVHHKVHVTADTINDPQVLTNPDNLVLLCRRCHGLQHGGKRYKIDEMGRVML